MALASSVSLYYSIVQRAARHYLEDYCHTGEHRDHQCLGQLGVESLSSHAPPLRAATEWAVTTD
ncbi:unnamed protein product [Plutella xylostella]|uniref:(diamondback moth) hypothetical protein n=1 Tax=Plutella xylostella TaxID=51655 RepID=A0A8S4CZM1_PLUXY|nr:unnamed protein product [Plutella xylostella]